MSSEFAFSETTPLRQTDYNNAITSTTAITLPNSLNSSGCISSNGSGGGGGGGNGSNIINNNNNSNNNIINNSSNNSIHNNLNNIINNRNSNNNSITTTPTGATIQVETGLNSNYNGYNNRILNRNQQTIGNTTQTTTNNNNNNDNNNSRIKGLKMDTHRKIVRKIAFDFAILLCVGIPILVFFQFVEPYKRGFFCDDESLKHPFHDSTVKNYMLYIIGILIPFCIILLMEYLHGRNRSAPKYRFLDSDISSWIVESYKQVGIFAFGAASQQLVVDIGKYSIGRLRPHFFDVCQPIMPDGTRCDNPINIGRYIEDFTCEAQHSTPRMLKNMRLSFPSGHSSFSAFTMVYCMIYLQSRMNWRGSKLLKHFIQLFLFSTTWFTALSRISDYKHHWSDVLAGAAIGIIFAIIVSQCIADFNQKNNFELPRTQNDATTATNLNITTTNHQQFTNYQQQNHQNSSNGHNNNHS